MNEHPPSARPASWAPWDCPCDGDGCDRMASSHLVGHPEIPNGDYCNAHLPKDDRGYTRCLND